MANVTYRISCRNNSDARSFDVLSSTSAKCKHNGGKLVIATVDASEQARVESMLDASHAVVGYEVER